MLKIKSKKTLSILHFFFFTIDRVILRLAIFVEVTKKKLQKQVN